MAQVKVLDFLGIGAPKSGTTSLFRYLRWHPAVSMPASKEIPFFANEERFARGWESYKKEFFQGTSENKLWGKITPQYWHNACVPERLFNSMPDVKLIAILRNPVDRAIAHYCMSVLRDKETRPFPEAAFDLSRRYLPGGQYATILKRYFQFFPREQLLVLFTDDLAQCPQGVINQILQHIGLQAGWTPPNLGKRYNVDATKKRFPWLVPLVRRVSPLRWMWNSLPEHRKAAVAVWYRKELNKMPEPPAPLSPELRQKLVEFFKGEVRELEDLLRTKVPWEEFHDRSGTTWSPYHVFL